MTLRRMPAHNAIPMTNAQYLRWKRPRPAHSPGNLEKTIADMTRAPQTGETIAALPGRPPADEMDAGFYGALRAGARVVGDDPGQVPLAVAERLFMVGLVARRT